MRRTVVVSLLTIVPAIAQAQDGVRPRERDPFGIVAFDHRSSHEERESMIDIEAMAEWQASHPDDLLFIEGRTSNQGSSTRNVRMSEARTEAVRSALIRAGADPARIVAVARSDRRGSEQNVVIRASNAFPDLAREQRDRNIGEDARRTGRTQRAARATQAPQAQPAPPTVVVVQPPAPVAPAPLAVEAPDSTAGSTTGLPPGGVWPSTGGNGVAAQTGIGMDPTDGSPEFTTGFGPREGFEGTGSTGGPPGYVPPPGPPVLVIPPGAPGARTPGEPGGVIPGAPIE